MQILLTIIFFLALLFTLAVIPDLNVDLSNAKDDNNTKAVASVRIICCILWSILFYYKAF